MSKDGGAHRPHNCAAFFRVLIESSPQFYFMFFLPPARLTVSHSQQTQLCLLFNHQPCIQIEGLKPSYLCGGEMPHRWVNYFHSLEVKFAWPVKILNVHKTERCLPVFWPSESFSYKYKYIFINRLNIRLITCNAWKQNMILKKWSV